MRGVHIERVTLVHTRFAAVRERKRQGAVRAHVYDAEIGALEPIANLAGARSVLAIAERLIELRAFGLDQHRTGHAATRSVRSSQTETGNLTTCV